MAVSVALVIHSVLVAFNLDQSTRQERMKRWMEHGRQIKD